MDVKSAFLYGEIKEEVYVTQPKGFEDPHNPKHVYRVVKALYGLHQAPRPVKQLPDGIFISQDKYVKDMLKKFDMKSVRTATTPYEVPKHKSKDDPDDAVNVHLFRSMIGSLMYLTASRPDIMFVLEAYSDSDYVGSHGDRKSTTGGCQFLGRRLISWQCTLDPEPDVLLLVVLVRADDLVPAGSCIIPTGSYSFMLMTWFLLDDHNKVAYLEKRKGWEAYEQILDFLNRSHIRYALTHRPTIMFDSLVKQFWATATVRTLEAGPSDIIATINGNEVVATESLIRTQVQLDDVNGLYEFTLYDVLDGMRAIGYPTDGSLTFYKAKLSPQWRFIMDGMIRNIGSKRHKFLMYPRFLQMILGIQTSDPSPRPTFNFTAKLFSNMKLNWDGPHMPLLASIVVVPAGGDSADAVAAGAAAAHDVSPPPPIVPPTHSTPGPSSTPQVTPVREPTPVRDPTPLRDPTPVRDPILVREPTPSPVGEPTPDSPRPPSPPPRTEEVGPTTSIRPPSPTRHTFVHEDISEGGGDFVSSSQSNEAPQTPAATAAGRAEDSAALTALSLKLDRCLHRVTTLENKLGITKKVLGGAVLRLVTRVMRLEGLLQQRKRRLVLSDSEGEDATPTTQDIDLAALHTLASASLGGNSFAPAAGPDADTTMPFRSTNTTRRHLRKPFTSFASAYVSKNIPAGASVPVAATTIHAGSFVDAAVHVVVAPSSSIPTAADKGKAPIVDDSLLADLLSEQEREAEFAIQQEEMAQKAQAERVASPIEHCPRMSDQRHQELDAAQLIYTEADWLELLAKIATNSAISKKLLGDDVPAGVPAAPLFPADVSVHAATSSAPADISVPTVSPAHVAASVPAETVVHTTESHLDDPLTASEHVSSEPTVAAPTPLSSRQRRKHIAKKRVTPIMDMAYAAMIKFDSDSDSDDDPLPYAPYAD
uniref:Reverse transcriptase Ty1/copia-type domain-containing protein n=1 Tax=Tanacetum cinerariifolium TaxID=118510 RepID=A0A6L2J4M2_TANCI|nr:hypothetical protein [Tanacetum cinerariifolium]